MRRWADHRNLLVILIVLVSFYFDWIYGAEIRQWLFKDVVHSTVADYRGWKHVLSKGLLAVGLLSLYAGESRVRGFIQVLVITIITLPNLTYFTHEEVNPFVPVLAALLPATVFLAPRMALPSVTLSSRMVLYLLGGLSLLSTIFFLVDFNSPLEFRNLLMQNDIYSRRALAASETSRFTAYTFGFVVSFLLPAALLAYWVKGGRWRYACLAILGMAVLVFAANPHKSILFNLAVVCFFALFRTEHRQALAWVSLIAIVCVLGRVEAAFHTDTQGYLEGFFLRRFFMLPAQFNAVYTSFFEGQPLLLSHSILSGVFEYPFDLDPARVIGGEVYGRSVSANNGFISDGFMNFGYLGAVVFSTFPIVLLTWLMLTRKATPFNGLLCIALVVFKNSAMLTALLTHGVLWFVILWIFFIPSLSDD